MHSEQEATEVLSEYQGKRIMNILATETHGEVDNIYIRFTDGSSLNIGGVSSKSNDNTGVLSIGCYKP